MKVTQVTHILNRYSRLNSIGMGHTTHTHIQIESTYVIISREGPLTPRKGLLKGPKHPRQSLTLQLLVYPLHVCYGTHKLPFLFQNGLKRSSEGGNAIYCFLNSRGTTGNRCLSRHALFRSVSCIKRCIRRCVQSRGLKSVRQTKPQLC